MQVLPSARSLCLLLAWSEIVARQRRWVRLTPADRAGLTGFEAVEIRECLQELTERGCCTAAAYGDLHYITRRGATLARAIRELLEQGASLSDLTPAKLGPKLIRFPFVFRDVGRDGFTFPAEHIQVTEHIATA
jgi:hypothetical protein